MMKKAVYFVVLTVSLGLFVLGYQPSGFTDIGESEQKDTGRYLKGEGDYKPMDLGTLGGNQSWAFEINLRGQVVGWSEAAEGEVHAFLWEKGEMIDLAPLGDTYSRALAINERGQVVGQSGSAHGYTAPVLWYEGEVTVLGDQFGNACATGINNRGQVVGNVQYGAVTRHAYLWEDGEEIFLGHPWGAQSTTAQDINEYGQIVGHSLRASPWNVRAFRWDNGMWTDLGTPEGWYQTSLSYAISNSGQQVVGYAHYGTGEWHAILWENGEIIDLGGTPGIEYTWAKDINARGQIVGYNQSNDGGVRHALLWEAGVMIPLTTLGGDYSEALSINANGQIVGSSQTGEGHYHATLWTR